MVVKSDMLCTISGAIPTHFQGGFPEAANVLLAKTESQRERTHHAQNEEVRMIAELNFLEEWIPEQMEPGTLFLLEQAGDLGCAENPYWAGLACPTCGSLGLITRQQCAGLETMICGSETCSAEYYLSDKQICYRRPN